MPLDVSRRRFLSFLAAPAIVHAGNLMPVRSIERLLPPMVVGEWCDYTGRITIAGIPIYFDKYLPPDQVYLLDDRVGIAGSAVMKRLVRVMDNAA